LSTEALSRRRAKTARRAAIVSLLARVTIFSTNGLTTLALAGVVMIRSWSTRLLAMFFIMAWRWLVVRPNRFPAQRCLMCLLVWSCLEADANA
jgi:hypothetical protein